VTRRPKGPKGQFAVHVWPGCLEKQSWGDLIGKMCLTIYWHPRRFVSNKAVTFSPYFDSKARLIFQCDQDTVRPGQEPGIGVRPTADNQCWYGPHWEADLNPGAVRTMAEVTRLLSYPATGQHRWSQNEILVRLGNVLVLQTRPNDSEFNIVERRTLVQFTQV
jgi:hypothetical protein